MLTIEITDARGTRQVKIERFPAQIGKGADCEIQLVGWRVARKHAEIHRIDKAFRLIDCGSINGTWVNGERITEFGPLQESDDIAIAGYTLRTQFVTRDLASGSRADAADYSPAITGARTDSNYLATFPLRRAIHRKLLNAIDLRRTDVRQLSEPQLRLQVRKIIEDLLDAENVLPEEMDRARFVEDSLDEALSLGPLERLLADDGISEIMVNSANEIYVERQGLLRRCDAAFTSDEALRQTIERIVTPLGRRIDEASPMVDARLQDGSRVNAIIPPLALRGPALTIRKFNRTPWAPADLIRLESANRTMMDFLKVCVQERLNIVIAGGTGSGKTTLLNVLSNLIPIGERVITIEDAAELRLDHEHLITLESRPPNLEGKGAVSIRDLVRNALRMRPDRIVVGECRGGEALDMLQAMNTGHDGSLTTIHANSPRDTVSRLEVLVLMAGMELPLSAVREQIASAVDIVVQQARGSDGKRRIQSIVEVSGMESGRVQLQELFRWEHSCFRSCGIVPDVYERLKKRGVAIDYSDFQVMSESAPAGGRV